MGLLSVFGGPCLALGVSSRPRSLRSPRFRNRNPYHHPPWLTCATAARRRENWRLAGVPPPRASDNLNLFRYTGNQTGSGGVAWGAPGTPNRSALLAHWVSFVAGLYKNLRGTGDRSARHLRPLGALPFAQVPYPGTLGDKHLRQQLGVRTLVQWQLNSH